MLKQFSSVPGQEDLRDAIQEQLVVQGQSSRSSHSAKHAAAETPSNRSSCDFGNIELDSSAHECLLVEGWRGGGKERKGEMKKSHSKQRVTVVFNSTVRLSLVHICELMAVTSRAAFDGRLGH